MPVSLGTDRLLASGRLDGRRVGVVCNPASIDAELRHIADRLVEPAAGTREADRASPPSSGRSTASGPTCRRT